MKNVAIIGTGTMGPGMAATLARGGMDVACYDASEAARDKAPGEVTTALAVLERIGGPAAATAGAVTMQADLADAVANADLVIEAVPENVEVKATLFRELDRLSKPDAILASNTSGIPISKIEQSVSDPSRIVGMHWSNPLHVIPVIEVIAGEKTAPEVVERLAPARRGPRPNARALSFATFPVLWRTVYFTPSCGSACRWSTKA